MMTQDSRPSTKSELLQAKEVIHFFCGLGDACGALAGLGGGGADFALLKSVSALDDMTLGAWLVGGGGADLALSSVSHSACGCGGGGADFALRDPPPLILSDGTFIPPSSGRSAVCAKQLLVGQGPAWHWRPRPAAPAGAMASGPAWSSQACSFDLSCLASSLALFRSRWTLWHYGLRRWRGGLCAVGLYPRPSVGLSLARRRAAVLLRRHISIPSRPSDRASCSQPLGR